MAEVLSMPRLSDTMVEGVLVSWQKQEGDPVEPGDVVAEIETDKATMELECYDSGFLAKQLLKAGEAIPVGGPIAIITEERDEDISTLLDRLNVTPASASDQHLGTPEEADSSASPSAAKGAEASSPKLDDSGVTHMGAGRVKASPLARAMARNNNLDLLELQGTGPGGRIIRRDIESSLQAHAHKEIKQAFQPLASHEPIRMDAGGERVPLSQMRKTIARRMTEAKLSVPHFYLTAEVNMGETMALRRQLNEAAAGDFKISINDFVLKASALALLKHPNINASFGGDHVIRHSSVHMGFAAAIEDGLITPTIRDCQTKTLAQIAQESRSLASRAMAKKLKPDEYTGATFTVSNLGMYGIVEFVAIINPPQAAILAVGSVRAVPVVVEGSFSVGQCLRVTLSCDHRVIDGAQGAQFLATLRETLENPFRLLL